MINGLKRYFKVSLQSTLDIDGIKDSRRARARMGLGRVHWEEDPLQTAVGSLACGPNPTCN